jgi:hypothetical protein
MRSGLRWPDRVLLHGALIEIDGATGRALKIQRVAEIVGS